MRSQCFITAGRRRILFVLCSSIILVGSAAGQRLAILTPDNSTPDTDYADQLAAHAQSSFRVIDRGQADAAFRSVSLDNPFNMTTSEARNVAAVIGCDAFLVIRSSVLRRTPVSGPGYFEAYAVHFLVDGRSGELRTWLRKSFEEESEQKAKAALKLSVAQTVNELSRKLRIPAVNSESINVESVPDLGSPAAANLKTPVPYKRIKPEYTRVAYLYDIKATVDIEVDVNADGSITATRITRWAGYDLDESVEKAVRAMNWRPAMRNGKPLPMRVLLRYNFTKVDKE